MENIEFKPFGKISRDNPFLVTITEKMDGSNACVIIKNGAIVGAQSRKKLITPENDNFGFATWVENNKEDLAILGGGYHFGEWVGPKIQKNPHALEENAFFLFNTFKKDSGQLPSCCNVVPVLFEGELTPDVVPKLLKELEENAKPGQTPEGVIVYYHAFKQRTKHTIKTPKGKWNK